MKLPPPPVRIAVYSIFFLLALALIYLGYSSFTRHESSLPVLGVVPRFSLTTEDRRTFTTENLLGRVTIADFIFTSCAGPCPLMSATMQQFQTAISREPGIGLLSFSVDPEFDSPDVLREYAHRFGAQKDKWTFLTGSKATIYDLTRNGFHLSLEADSDAIAHSTKFVLIDKSAKIRGYYDSGDDSTGQILLRDAVELSRE